MLTDAIARMEQVIEAETNALLAREPLDHDDINRRKSQLLLELSRLTRSLSPEIVDGQLRHQIEQLRTKLDRNLATLGMHLKAVEEVADVISGAMRHAESDGTYSAQGGRWGAR